MSRRPFLLPRTSWLRGALGPATALASALLVSSCLTPDFSFGTDPSERANAHCSNREKDADETDTDCGGKDCDPCELEQACKTGGDCVNGTCTAGVCQDANCQDGIKSGTETDVDCGGDGCPGCAAGLVCDAGSDCRSGVCNGGTCAEPTCDDRVKNGGETGVDCGGDCDLCDVGQGCVVNEDCKQPTSDDTAVTVCADDVCTVMCDTGTADCNEKAADGCEVNTNTALSHCGGCGMSCDPPNSAAAKCQGGLCLIDFDEGGCADGFADCNGEPSDGCEVNLNTSAKHCGACNEACSDANGTPSCSGGICAITCDGGFEDCDGDARANGCEINTKSDVKHCNGCKNACSTGGASQSPFCADGSCGLTTCPSGKLDCDGDGNCTDDDDTVQNCGSCGNTCTANDATTTCNGSLQCAISSCKNGMRNCNSQYADGCESNPDVDVKNCGGCAGSGGQDCTALQNNSALHISAINCDGGSCRITGCTAPYADCDGNPSNGCEVNTNSSDARCGGCVPGDARAADMGGGENCDTKWANAGGSCVSGVCSNFSCNSGYGNCSGGQADGCETDTTSSNAHCGACNSPCQNNASTKSNTCGSSKCTAVCESTGAQCDGNQKNGCENIDSSKSNCGSCGNACGGTGTNVDSASCSGGSCSVTCTNNKCPDSSAAMACTENLGTKQNCSFCGETCSASQFCNTDGCKNHREIVLGNTASVKEDPSGASTSLSLTLSYSAAQNRRRAVVVLVSNHANQHPPQVTFAGTTMSSVGQVFGNNQWVGAFYLTEESLPSSAGSYTVQATLKEGGGSPTGSFVMHAMEFSGVERVADSGPVRDSSLSNDGSCSTTTTGNLDVSDGSWVLAVSGAWGGNAGSPQGSLVETYDEAQNNNRAMFGYIPWSDLTAGTGKNFTFWSVGGCSSTGTAAISLRPSSN